MKRFGLAAAALMLILALAPATEATTTWTARPAGHGIASLRAGSPSRLVLGLTGFRAGSIWTVSLRRGSCASAGTLVVSLRLTATATGRLSKTVVLTTAQTRAARLPLTLRFGSRCAPFAAPAAIVATPSPSPTPTPEPGTFGDGTWRVGTTVQPGTYAAAGSDSCYWARLSGFGGTTDEIIANSFGSGAQIVTIAATDAGFTTHGCGTWHRQGDVVATPVPTATPHPTMSFGTYTLTIDSVTTWPAGLLVNAEPAGYVLVSVNVTMARTAGGAGPTFTIRGPSGTPYGGVVPTSEPPALDATSQVIGTQTGNVTFAVLPSDVGHLVMTINGSTDVQL